MHLDSTLQRRLRDFLAEHIPREDEARLLCRDAGLSTARIPMEGSAGIRWGHILTEVGHGGDAQTTRFLTEIVTRLPILLEKARGFPPEWKGLAEGREQQAEEIMPQGSAVLRQHVRCLRAEYARRDRLAKELELPVDAPEVQAVNARILVLKQKLRRGGEFHVGDVLADRYILRTHLGSGGFSVVWQAKDRETGGWVAVKLLHQQFRRDLSRLQRFYRGARAMARLQHPNIVAVLEEGRSEDLYEAFDGNLPGGHHFFVMEYVDGVNFHQAVLEEGCSEARVLQVVRAVGHALAFAHAQGIIHRDVKPANILLGKDHNIKLTDFDLVHVPDSTGGTRTAGLGTFIFAAPEAVGDASRVTPQADVFSLAMTTLFGFKGEPLTQKDWRNPRHTVESLEIPEVAKAVLLKGLAEDATDRLPTVQHFVEGLVACFEGEGVDEEKPGIDTEVVSPTRPERRSGGESQAVEAPPVVTPSGGGEAHETPSRLRVSTGSVLMMLLGAVVVVAWFLGVFGGKGVDRVTGGDGVQEWVQIPGGELMMGSNDGDSDEKPVHKVSVSPFKMSKTEVTVAQYRACVEAGACTEPDGKESSNYCNWGQVDRENHPINCVDWSQAKVFAAWVGGRLPTEAEWEFAARGTGKALEKERTYPWGEAKATCARAVMKDGSRYGCGVGNEKGPSWPVCAKESGNTPEDLCDMAGNVWEWVEDDYHDSYNNAPENGSAWVDSPRGSSRVFRGGSWFNSAVDLRGANRSRSRSGNRSDGLGFRVVAARPR